jgi:hypothetical protein
MGEIDYTTGVTGDVIKYLSGTEVLFLLDKIRNLPAS